VPIIISDQLRGSSSAWLHSGGLNFRQLQSSQNFSYANLSVSTPVLHLLSRNIPTSKQKLIAVINTAEPTIHQHYKPIWRHSKIKRAQCHCGVTTVLPPVLSTILSTTVHSKSNSQTHISKYC